MSKEKLEQMYEEWSKGTASRTNYWKKRSEFGDKFEKYHLGLGGSVVVVTNLLHVFVPLLPITVINLVFSAVYVTGFLVAGKLELLYAPRSKYDTALVTWLRDKFPKWFDKQPFVNFEYPPFP